MMTKVTLSLHFEGDFPGIAEKKLSISAFGSVLPKLLIAVRKSIEVSMGTAVNEVERRRGTNKTAGQFDLQLKKISDGSLAMEFEVFFKDSGEGDEFLALAEKGVTRFVDEVEHEWNHDANSTTSVHRFLNSLPEGIIKQKYEARSGDQVLRSLNLNGRGHNSDAKRGLSRLVEISGDVHSITFDAKFGSVKLKDREGDIHGCKATERITEMAVSYHKISVIGTVLRNGDKQRLLILRPRGEDVCKLTPQERSHYLVERWANVLKRLGE
jgi:hypothetical protein